MKFNEQQQEQRHFWLKRKRIEENLQMKKPTSKQTRLFQAKMFLWNGTTGQIEQFSFGKSLAGKDGELCRSKVDVRQRGTERD